MEYSTNCVLNLMTMATSCVIVAGKSQAKLNMSSTLPSLWLIANCICIFNLVKTFSVRYFNSKLSTVMNQQSAVFQ